MTKLSKFATVILVLSIAVSAGAQRAHYTMSSAWPADIGSGFEVMEDDDLCRSILAGLNKTTPVVSPEHWVRRRWQEPLQAIGWSILPHEEGIGYARMFATPTNIPSAFQMAIKQGSDLNSYSVGISNAVLYRNDKQFSIYAVFDRTGRVVGAYAYTGGSKSLLTSFRSLGEFEGKYNGQFLVNGRYFQWSANLWSWSHQAGRPAGAARWQVAVYMAFPPDPELDTPANDVAMPQVCNFPYDPR